MGRDFDGQNHVSGAPAHGGGLALPAQADLLASLDASRNLHVQRSARGQSDARLAALDRPLQRHGDDRRQILALSGRIGAGTRAPSAAKQIGENIGRIEPARVAPTRSARLELEITPIGASSCARSRGPPAGARTAKALEPARPAVGVNLAAIKFAALIGIAQNFVGGVDFRELVLGLRVARVLVRMELFSQPAISLLDVVRRGRFRNSQNAVRIACRHNGSGPAAARQGAAACVSMKLLSVPIWGGSRAVAIDFAHVRA